MLVSEVSTTHTSLPSSVLLLSRCDTSSGVLVFAESWWLASSCLSSKYISLTSHLQKRGHVELFVQIFVLVASYVCSVVRMN